MDLNTPETTLGTETPATPSIPVEETLPTQPKNRVLKIGLVLALLLLTGTSFALYSQMKTSPSSTLTSPSPTPLASTMVNTYEEFLTAAGFRLGVPRGWEVSISTNTTSVLAARFYPSATDQSTTYLDIQVGPTNQFALSPTITIVDSKVDGDLTIRTGKENLLDSKRLVFQVERVAGNNQAILTLYGDQLAIDQYQQEVINILRSAISQRPLNWDLVSRVHAQEVASPSAVPLPSQIAGFNLSDWKEIVIMEGPYPERLTETDKAYKDGYARLYTFTVIPGQRVEVLAEEGKDAMAKSGSFIESEIYGANGTLITKAGTRIALSEYDKFSKGGRYYLIVKSYPGKTGEFLLKVFDLDQVQDLYYAHYADGSEILTNNVGKNTVNKNQPAVMIVHFTSPIEIIDGNKVRYFREKDNGCIACDSYVFGDITIPYVFKVNNVETPIKITKIFLNQALIQPLSGEGFPINSQVSFEIDYGADPTNPGFRSGYAGGFRTY